MQTGHKLLAKVVFNHSYFQNGVLHGLSVRPSAMASNLMNKFGLLFKSDISGFAIYCNNDHKLLGHISIDFNLIVNDPEFYNYTLLNDAATKKLLTQGVSVTNTKAKVNSALLGNLKLSLKQDAEHSYTITFEAKSAYWRYFFVGHDFTNLNLPVVINKVTKIVFDQLTNQNLPNGTNALVFQSKESIMLSDLHLEDYQLGQDYNAITGKYTTVLKTLPYPDLSSAAVNDGLKEFYEIYIY